MTRQDEHSGLRGYPLMNDALAATTPAVDESETAHA